MKLKSFSILIVVALTLLLIFTPFLFFQSFKNANAHVGSPNVFYYLDESRVIFSFNSNSQEFFKRNEHPILSDFNNHTFSHWALKNDTSRQEFCFCNIPIHLEVHSEIRLIAIFNRNINEEDKNGYESNNDNNYKNADNGTNINDDNNKSDGDNILTYNPNDNQNSNSNGQSGLSRVEEILGLVAIIIFAVVIVAVLLHALLKRRVKNYLRQRQDKKINKKLKEIRERDALKSSDKV